MAEIRARYATDWDDESYSQEQFEADVGRVLAAYSASSPAPVTPSLASADAVLKRMYMPPVWEPDCSAAPGIPSQRTPVYKPDKPAWVREAEDAQLLLYAQLSGRSD